MSRKKGSSPLEDPEYEQPPEVWAKGYQAARSGSGADEEFVIGQRWASDMEPELGIGTLTRIDPKRVTLSFRDSESVREYSRSSAPLRRIRFRAGDTIRNREGCTVHVESIQEKDGLLTYRTSECDIPETELSDSIRFTAPLDRLLSGRTDKINDFRLRARAVYLRHRLDKSPVRGFCGARIDLIPHQLYIAGESASGHVRRILLADEVGLGKTIEACLVLHRLLVCGRAVRALVCVPQSIVHVWFVELLRKFNLVFRIIDSEYFESATASAGGDKDAGAKNPFLGDQLVLCDIGFLSRHESAASCAIDAGWDVLIIDEAHHLCEGTPLFDLAGKLSAKSRDVFLLTATPQQHGELNHFQRLRLLDPARYPDFETFLKESKAHVAIAELTSRLLDKTVLNGSDRETLCSLLDISDKDLDKRIGSARQRVVSDLLDRFGTGRAMFRNTRAVIGGFSRRLVNILPLAGSKAVRENARADLGDMVPPVLSDDPRIDCLAGLLREFPNDKFLLICRHSETVTAIEKALLRKIAVNVAQFHEKLTLIARDRNAAWFGEEDGARILLCSEIGSEGRNFQFCHHLFLWDLPLDCELIEQRIGRLDRIGQKGPVSLHVPYITDSSSEAVCRWLHEAAGIFDSVVPAAQEALESCSAALVALAARASASPPENKTWKADLAGLIDKSKSAVVHVAARLEQGRDRLLEQHSYKPDIAASVARRIRAADTDTGLENFLIDLFRFHGVFAEPLGKRTYKLWSESPLDESFPALRTSRPLVTFDRSYALVREDIEFITADHPAVQNGLEMFLGSEKGNCCCAVSKSFKERGMLLEAVFIVDCVASPGLYVDRFLPPTPVRIIVDHRLCDRSDIFQTPDFEPSLQDTDELLFLDNSDMKTALLPGMQARAAECAEKASRKIIEEAKAEMQKIVGAEAERLVALSAVNPHIRREEIDAIRKEIADLDKAISGASPRLDSVRLILGTVGRKTHPGL